MRCNFEIFLRKLDALIWFINCFLMTRCFYPYYKWNSVEFLVDFPMLDYFNIDDFHIGFQVSVFETGLDISMPCRLLRGVLEN